MLEGKGWKESCRDVVFSGLGWVSFTGCGLFKVKFVFVYLKVSGAFAIFALGLRCCRLSRNGLIKGFVGIIKFYKLLFVFSLFVFFLLFK